MGDATPDTELLAVLWLELDEGYHAYANPPGETGMPTHLSISLDGGSPLKVIYPEGEEEPDVFDPSLMVHTYYGSTPLFVPLGQLPTSAISLTGSLSFAACSATNCWPLRTEVSLPLTGINLASLPDATDFFWYEFYLNKEFSEVVDTNKQNTLSPSTSESTTEAPATSPPSSVTEWSFSPTYFHPELEVTDIELALLFAFIAGLLLNFMPCVLPVLSLKLSALMAGSEEQTEADRIRAFREHNLFFSAGVMLYFLFLGALLSALGLAWGQLFQTPGLILGLATVVFALGLSLFGLWDLPVVDLKADRSSGSPKVCALFTGVLATLLATPCSGPFLGGVLGWVLLQSPETIMAVFLTIGLGMASPFLLMTARPGLVRLFPKPGNWMIYLEAGVGFFLMGTVLYLLTILPTTMLLPALGLLLAVAFAAWMWGKWTNLSQPKGKRWAIRLAAAALVALAALMLFAPKATPIKWQSFEPQAFRSMLGKRPIVVDFTADWCPNCKVLEHTTLKTDNLTKWQEHFDLTYVQVDMTQDNPEGLALLRALGSQSIPVVAIFPPGPGHKSPLVLRDLFSASQMDDALKTTLGD
ncbi:protein-disulfide reductase [Desulfovibrio ferrophilus]|uniref:Protein-disulfide reductase n=1 Tax=Desulfovibrio ferrophilus TaxID=241368 RepID=A0A2Z6AYF8_9BACT|nr:protein-disulfide reductase [Desulfovibrio ferrophilus]